MHRKSQREEVSGPANDIGKSKGPQKQITGNLHQQLHSTPGTAELLTDALTNSESNMMTSGLSSITHGLPLPSTWHQIPVHTTKSGRRLGNGWVDVFQKVLETKAACCWKFKGNFVKKPNSRKDTCAYWKGKAICDISSCGITAKMVIQNETDDFMMVSFSDDPRHDGKDIKARRIAGEKRKEVAERFVSNPALKPEDEYSRLVGNLDPHLYSSGNRTGAGISPNAMRILSSRARQVYRTPAGLEPRMSELRRRIVAEDKETAKQLNRENVRQFYGLLHDCIVVHDRIRVILLEEDRTRFYHNVAKRVPLFIDATGGLVSKVSGSKRILYYAMVVPHPFGTAPPLPVAEMISYEHSADSIRRLFQELKMKEKCVYPSSRPATPMRLMKDFSLAIINAALSEFNQETHHDYLDRTLKIMQGTAPVSNLNMTFIFLCRAHIMKMAKKHVSRKNGISAQISHDEDLNKETKRLNSQQNFALRLVGRLINTESLDEALEVLRPAYILLNSRKATLQVLTASREFTRSINTFKTEISRNIDEANDTERDDYTGCQIKSDSNAHSEKDLMKADGTNVRNFWREELELMEKSIVQQSKHHPDNAGINLTGYHPPLGTPGLLH